MKRKSPSAFAMPAGLALVAFVLVLFVASCSKSTTNPNAAFIGTYDGSEVDGSVLNHDTITITAGSSSTAVNLLVRTSVPSTYNYTGTVSGNALTIPSQPFSYGNQVDTISGSGSLTGNTLTINYTIKTSTASYNWVYTGTD